MEFESVNTVFMTATVMPAEIGYTVPSKLLQTCPEQMRYREGQEEDPNNPYPDSTMMMMETAYWMSIPIGLLLLWIGIKGRVMWLKVWSIGLMALGIGILLNEYFGFIDLVGGASEP